MLEDDGDRKARACISGQPHVCAESLLLRVVLICAFFFFYLAVCSVVLKFGHFFSFCPQQTSGCFDVHVVGVTHGNRGWTLFLLHAGQLVLVIVVFLFLAAVRSGDGSAVAVLFSKTEQQRSPADGHIHTA